MWTFYGPRIKTETVSFFEKNQSDDIVTIQVVYSQVVFQKHIFQKRIYTITLFQPFLQATISTVSPVLAESFTSALSLSDNFTH